MKATIKPFLYKRRIKANGKYPVKLKVTFKREQVFYDIGIDMTEKEFSEYHINKKLKRHFEDIIFYQKKAEKIINDFKDVFSFKIFRDQFYKSEQKVTEKETKKIEFFSFSNNHINWLKKMGRMKFAASFENSHSYLKKYVNKEFLQFSELTTDFIKGLHKSMQLESRSISTIGIYLRNIRRLFNLAIADGIVSQEAYPFGRNKYSPPTSRKAKKALHLTDIEKIYNYEPQSEIEGWAKDMWLFAYFANGINVKDISLLKNKNIQSDEILFVREKTVNSVTDVKTIRVVLIDELKEIITRQRKNDYPEAHIFNIIEKDNPTPEEIYLCVANATKTINKYMYIIAENLGLERRPSTNFARHSYATVLKRAGISIEMISEQLGHTTVKTTEIYLDSFEKEQRLELAKHLTAFKTKAN